MKRAARRRNVFGEPGRGWQAHRRIFEPDEAAPPACANDADRNAHGRRRDRSIDRSGVPRRRRPG
ncbi:hypothetical protein PSMK_06780 [Phycisphaera mikurensis NBRC 102666]|uniref:Uncharacterized protein n=1 Tax=Phycisphaera mikurensis (strain NBRC 102666 / KCTC 22515 / FYK2301M01) TaxID=1142394 RepID=I0IC49_PHYMF|nr:hypothetical protein PSMK_06780 [Phycisphaera mikurensis NBRC 102666]